MGVALRLSHQMMGEVDDGRLISESKEVSHWILAVVEVMALYSTSVDDRATVFYFFEL